MGAREFVLSLNGFIQFGVLVIVWCRAHMTARLISRVPRTIKVALRGWPPPHLDADGDWKPEPKRDDP